MFGFGKKKKFEPHTIENECGKFTMEYFNNDPNQPTYCYDGETILPLHNSDGEPIFARVEWDEIDPDRIDECVAKGFARLKEVIDNFPYWEAKVKREALESEWLQWSVSEEDRRKGLVYLNYKDTITQEEFMSRIYVGSIIIMDGERVEIWLNSDGYLLGDDGFGVIVDENDNIIEYT